MNAKVRFRVALSCVCLLGASHVRSIAAAEFVLAEGQDMVGTPGSVTAVYEDTLVDIARANQLGYEEIRLANPGVDAWLPGEGTQVNLPTRFILPRAQRTGIVVNVAEYRMYYFFDSDGENRVRTFPISIGRMDWGTPLGNATIVAKVRNPSWYPPQSIRDEWAADGRVLGTHVPPGPNNPLGKFALRLSIPGYLIHGTNRPAGVGMRVTHGCIRMFPEDIAWLFPQVPVETKVRVVNQPFKLGWSGVELYLEVHPPLEEGGASEESADGEIIMQSPDESSNVDAGWSITDITSLFIEVTRERAAMLDWELVQEVYEQRRGLPVRVGVAVEALPESVRALRLDPVGRD